MTALQAPDTNAAACIGVVSQDFNRGIHICKSGHKLFLCKGNATLHFGHP